MVKKDLKKWAVIYKCLGSPYRLRILQLLQKNKNMSVTDISLALGISLKNTSRNLAILQNLGFVEAQGKQGHVPYSLNRGIEKEIADILKISIF